MAPIEFNAIFVMRVCHINTKQQQPLKEIYVKCCRDYQGPVVVRNKTVLDKK